MFNGWQDDPVTRQKLVHLINLIDRQDTLYIGFNIGYDLHVLYKIVHELCGEPLDSPNRPAMPFKCKVLDLQSHAMVKSVLAPFAYSRGANRSVALLRRVPKRAQDIVISRVTDELRAVIPKSFELKIGMHEVKGQPDLVTLSWYTKGGLRLKGLMREYGYPTLSLAEVWPLPDKGVEKQWLPYPDPEVHDPISLQCDEVMRNPDSPFWKYAELDILYLKVLYELFGHPEPDHHDECAHAVAYARYYGFDVDQSELYKTRTYYQHKVDEIERSLQGINLRSSTQRLELLRPHFPLIASTRKSLLKILSKEPGVGGKLAQNLLDYGPTRQRLLQCDKIAECRTGKAHPDLRVMGTATYRMAGTGGLNWQGIGAVDYVDPELLESGEYMVGQAEQSLEEGEEIGEARELDAKEAKAKVGIRHCILAESVGDWSSFEVCLASKIYNDPQLIQDLADGIDVHGMATATAHPKALQLGMTYDEVMAAYKAHEPTVTSWRKEMKSIVFGIFYFVSPMKVAQSLGVSVGEAERVLNLFFTRYPAIKRYRMDVEKRFITADTQRWSAGSVKRMAREQTDLLGFTRRWDFEAQVAEILWSLAKSGIRTGIGGRVIRTKEKGPQSYDMAVSSALYGSAIAIQGAVSRQAGNMPVQATGANLTKKLGAVSWQKHRAPWLCIHDELVYAAHPNFSPQVLETQQAFVEECREIVPSLNFASGLCSRWSDK